MKTKDMTRELILLRAAVQLIRKCEEGPYVQNVLTTTAVWDGVNCDGGCLLEEATQLLEELGVDVYVEEYEV